MSSTHAQTHTTHTRVRKLLRQTQNPTAAAAAEHTSNLPATAVCTWNIKHPRCKYCGSTHHYTNVRTTLNKSCQIKHNPHHRTTPPTDRVPASFSPPPNSNQLLAPPRDPPHTHTTPAPTQPRRNRHTCSRQVKARWADTYMTTHHHLHHDHPHHHPHPVHASSHCPPTPPSPSLLNDWLRNRLGNLESAVHQPELGQRYVVPLPLRLPSTHAGTHSTNTHPATNTHLVTTPVNATTSASQADSTSQVPSTSKHCLLSWAKDIVPLPLTQPHTCYAPVEFPPHNHTPRHNTTPVNQPNPLPTPVKQDSMHSTKCAP